MPDVSAQDPASLANGIRALFAEDRMPDAAQVDLMAWMAAIELLMQQNEFAAARHGFRILRKKLPRDIVQTILRVIDLLPPPEPQSAFTDDPRAEVQIVPREGAETAIVVFPGIMNMIDLPFTLVHRWLGPVASVIYLRDRSSLNFFEGVSALGSSRQETLAALRGIVADIGARRVACFGNSIGSFAAVLYATDLGADAVAGMGGLTDLKPLRSKLGDRLRSIAEVPRNLREVLAGAARPPPVLMVCGDRNWDDRLQAENLADLPNVAVRMVERHRGHAIVSELICREQFGRVVTWMMEAGPGRLLPPDPFVYEPWRESASDH